MIPTNAKYVINVCPLKILPAIFIEPINGIFILKSDTLIFCKLIFETPIIFKVNLAIAGTIKLIPSPITITFPDLLTPK